MKTMRDLIGIVLLIGSLAGCERPAEKRPDVQPDNGPEEAADGQSPDVQPGVGLGEAAKEELPDIRSSKGPEEIVSGELYTASDFALIIPSGWRNLMLPTSGNPLLYLNGDGIAAPGVDETGAPLQIGLSVEKFRSRGDTLDGWAKRMVGRAQASPSLELVGKAQVDRYQLIDGTQAALVTTEFIKQQHRRSLQMKLLAKDDASDRWVVSGWIVGGKNSKIPTPNSSVAKMLRAHLTSFGFDAGQVAQSIADDKPTHTE